MLETLTQTVYVIPTYGAACVTLNDQLLSYYDYSGQNLNLLEFSNTPLQTTTTATTLGPTAATVSGAARGRTLQTAPAGPASISPTRRANFVATVERVKIAHARMLLTHLTEALRERTHR